MSPTADPSAYAKFVGAIKDLPVWMFMAFAAAAAILLLVYWCRNQNDQIYKIVPMAV